MKDCSKRAKSGTKMVDNAPCSGRDNLWCLTHLNWSWLQGSKIHLLKTKLLNFLCNIQTITHNSVSILLPELGRCTVSFYSPLSF